LKCVRLNQEGKLRTQEKRIEQSQWNNKSDSTQSKEQSRRAVIVTRGFTQDRVIGVRKQGSLREMEE